MLKLHISRQIKLFLSFFIAILFSSTATANINKPSNIKKDSEHPTEITSDTAEFDDKTGKAIYSGKVSSKQGSRKLWSDVLTIYRGKDNKISKMIAEGKNGNRAKIRSQPNPNKPVGKGSAKTIQYFPAEEKALLIGKAELEQGGDIIRGESLSYYPEKNLLISNPVPNARTKVILQPRLNTKHEQ